VRIVYAAIVQNGVALRYTSTKIQGHTDVVIKAIMQDSGVLQDASLVLRDDLTLVTQALVSSLFYLQDSPGHASRSTSSQGLPNGKEHGIKGQVSIPLHHCC
jgi:hypothetical protein